MEDMGNVYFLVENQKLPFEAWRGLSSNESDEAQKWLAGKEGKSKDEINRYGYYNYNKENGVIEVDKGNPIKDGTQDDSRVADFVGRKLERFNGDDCMKARKLMLEGKLPSESEEDAGVRAAYGFSVAGNAKPYFKYEEYVDNKNQLIIDIFSEGVQDKLGLLGHILWGLGNGSYALKDDIVSQRMMKSLELNDPIEYFNKLEESIQNQGDFDNLLSKYNELKNQATTNQDTKIIEDMNNDISLVNTFFKTMPPAEGYAAGARFLTDDSWGGGGVSRLRKKRRNTRRKNTRRRNTRRKNTRRRNTRRRNTRRKNTRRKNTRRRNTRRKNTIRRNTRRRY
jgi:hypothetical protein